MKYLILAMALVAFAPAQAHTPHHADAETLEQELHRVQMEVELIEQQMRLELLTMLMEEFDVVSAAAFLATTDCSSGVQQ